MGFLPEDQAAYLLRVSRAVGHTISYQHFADILRLCLLAHNAYSIWADATVLLRNPKQLLKELDVNLKLPRGGLRPFETWLIYNGQEQAIFEEWAQAMKAYLSPRFTAIDDWDRKTQLSKALNRFGSYQLNRWFYTSRINRELLRYRTYFQTNYVGEALLKTRLHSDLIYFHLDTQANEIAHYHEDSLLNPILSERIRLSYALKLNLRNLHFSDAISNL